MMLFHSCNFCVVLFVPVAIVPSFFLSCDIYVTSLCFCYFIRLFYLFGWYFNVSI